MRERPFYLRFPPRRKREGKTDYRLRLKLVKSGLPRIVIRRSNRYVRVMVVRSKAGGDETLVFVTSKDLRKYGWMLGTKNTPAAYLTGFLAAKLALRKGITKAIADIGLHRATPGSRVFAAIKGAIDGGMEIPMGDGAAPEEDRILGRHITEFAKIVATTEGTHQFSRCNKELLLELPKHFEEVKSRIESA